MKRLVLAIAMAGACSAWSQVSCTQIGAFTTCSDGSSSQRIGNFVFGSDGSSSQRIGNNTFITPPQQPVYPMQPMTPMPQMPQMPPMYPQPQRCGWVNGRYVCG